MRHWGDAAETFRRLAIEDPSEPILHSNAAEAYMRMGLFAEAREQLAAALRTDSENPTANCTLATLYYLTEHPEAGTLARKALNLEEDFSSLLLSALTLSRGSDEHEKALAHFKRAPDEASQLNREMNFDLVIYALRVLQEVH